MKEVYAIKEQMSKSIEGLNNIKADIGETKDELREELNELLSELEREE